MNLLIKFMCNVVSNVVLLINLLIKFMCNVVSHVVLLKNKFIDKNYV